MIKKLISGIKQRWHLVILFAIIGGAVLYKSGFTQTSTVKGNKTYKIKKVSVQETLSLSGQIDAEEKATLRFQTSGRLSWIGVKVGDRVKKYQGIASLDTRDVKNKFQQYLNDYVKTRRDYDESLDDNTRKMNESVTKEARDEAKRLIEKAQYDLQSSVLDVELQQLALEYSYLSSPIDGIVVEAKSPVAGVNITPTQAEFVIINPQTIYFSALADQTDVVKIREGMKGELTFDSFPEIKKKGVVTSIAFTPKADETGTVYEVKITLSNADEYRMGMTGDVTFNVGSRRRILQIPTAFIKEEKGSEYVLTDSAGKKVKKFIKTGEVDGEMTEVTSGLKEGDTVYD